MILSASLLAGTACFAASAGIQGTDLMRDGLFVGVGADYNSINLTQNAWGKGIGDVTTNTGANTTGIAEGDGAPFNDFTQTFSPEIQVGYFRHFPGTQNLYGFKFFWQYLGATATNPNYYIPQVGTSTNNNTGDVSALFGWVNVDSIQITTNHEFGLLAFVGQSFGSKYFYVGAGPSLINIQSKNYYAIGYAEIDGATVDMTGLVSYASPSMWILGGTAQLGMTYFISPTWFLDISYNYTVSGSRTVHHQQTYSNTSTIGSTTYTSTGTLYTKNILRLHDQSVRLSINKVFDI